nr:immunoglobulin light chain junction region [Macaca mulatta]MOV77274.1 immunoglobulin light chain junction region [Macaca mulatta]
CQHYNDQLSF